MARQKIMYIENKNGKNDLIGSTHIGRVTFSKSGQSIHYNGRTFETLNGNGFKSNYSTLKPAITTGFQDAKRMAKTDYTVNASQS